METTTTKTCSKCEDRGVIHKEIFPGAWSIGQCDCRPPEYWAERSKRDMEALRQRIEEAKKRGLGHGKADTRGQKH